VDISQTGQKRIVSATLPVIFDFGIKRDEEIFLEPNVPDNLLKGLTRESTIKRDAFGRWFHEGQPIEHPNIIRAFNQWIGRAEDGRYCLKNEYDWVYIDIEGPPLFVRALRFDESGQVILLLSDARECVLDPATLRQGVDGALYCDVSDKTLVARFDGLAMVQLEELIDEDDNGVFLTIGSEVIRPRVVDNPLELYQHEA
jgi:uncharacterized protein